MIDTPDSGSSMYGHFLKPTCISVDSFEGGKNKVWSTAATSTTSCGKKRGGAKHKKTVRVVEPMVVEGEAIQE